MSDLDPQIGVLLEGFVPTRDEAGDWSGVLADAGATRPRRWRASRLALAVAALAALAAALAIVPALAGQGYFWFLDISGAPTPTTPVVVVTSFTDRTGTNWELTAYRFDNGLCTQLSKAGTNGRTGAGGCGSDLPLNAAVLGGSTQPTFVYGPAPSEAQGVEIVGSSDQIAATVTTAPEALRTDAKFYIAELPEGMPGRPLTVKALDAQKRVMATWTVPG